MATAKDSQPKVPEHQSIDISSLKVPSEADRPEYEPMSPNDLRWWMDTANASQLAWAPQILEQQRLAQSTLFGNMAQNQIAYAPHLAGAAQQVLQDYDPQFRETYANLGRRVNEGLSSGYELGEGLSQEIEQGIRGAQTARGNWLGPAPTAQEAFGKGQAALNLYNTRLGQAQNYLQGRNPIDMMGQTAGAFMGQQYYPSQSYVDSGLGASSMAAAGSQAQQFNSTVMQGYSTYQNALQNYNQNTIGATSANNEAMFGQYDRTADAWMYREAARNGLYSTPQVGGGGGMGGAGGMMGSIGGAVGTGMMGLAASGIIGGGATAAGVGIAGAAAGAAAAICWLARKLIPDKWKSYRKWLFTGATAEERRDYIYNARRIANAIA